MLRGEPKEEGGYRNCMREPIALVGMGRQENNMWLPLGIRARPGSSHGLGPMAQPTASKVLREDFDWIMSELNRPSLGGKGKILHKRASLRHNATLAKIAQRIVYISDRWHAIVGAG